MDPVARPTHRPRSRLRAIALAALGVCATFSLAAASQPGLDVLVMSFNLRWDGFDDGPNDWTARRPAVIALIRHYAPDFIGFQEPSRAQSEDLAAALPGYRIVIDEHPRSASIPIAVRSDRFQTLDSGSFWLVENSPLPGGTRRCAWLRVWSRATGRSLYVYNVHLDGRDTRARERSVVELMEHIARRQPADPFVITGDFNAIELDPSVSYLEGISLLPDDAGRVSPNPLPVVDSFRERHTENTGIGSAHGFTGRTDRRRIDYIFVGKEAAVLDAAIIRDRPQGRYPSDHFPVIARIRYPGD